MSEAVVAASAAICIAVLGALLSYASTRRLDRAKARLDRLNAQLQEFYGPLYAIFQAEHIAHLKFVDTLRPGSSTLFAPDVPPLNDDELALWHLWAQSTHQHRSSRAYAVIISKAHLLIEDEMPPSLLTFCAHKAGYDVLIERWKQQDYSEHLSVVRHPGDELRDYLRESFTRLKREQARELEATQGRTSQQRAISWPRRRATRGRAAALVVRLEAASMPFKAGHVADWPGRTVCEPLPTLDGVEPLNSGGSDGVRVWVGDPNRGCGGLPQRCVPDGSLERSTGQLVRFSVKNSSGFWSS